MTKIEILADKVKIMDKNFFMNDICEILEQMEEDEKQEMMKKQSVCIYSDNDHKTIENLLEEMRKNAIEHQMILNSHLFLYLVFVDKRNINKNWNSFKLTLWTKLC